MVLRSRKLRWSCSPQLTEELSKLINHDSISAEDKEILQRVVAQGDCTVEELTIIVRLREKYSSGKGAKSIMEMVEAKKALVLPTPEEIPPNPEMEKRREWLLARQAHREYQEKIKNISLDRRTTVVPRGEIRTIMKEVSAGFSMLLICVGVFFAVFITVKQLGYSNAVALSLGLGGGIFMLFVEMILYIIRSTREEGKERFFQAVRANEPNNISNIPGIWKEN